MKFNLKNYNILTDKIYAKIDAMETKQGNIALELQRTEKSILEVQEKIDEIEKNIILNQQKQKNIWNSVIHIQKAKFLIVLKETLIQKLELRKKLASTYKRNERTILKLRLSLNR